MHNKKNKQTKTLNHKKPTLDLTHYGVTYSKRGHVFYLWIFKANFKLKSFIESEWFEVHVELVPCVQHGASATEGRPPGSLRGDLAGLPLLRRPPPVCAGSLLGGGAEDGSLPQAALLPAGPGHGPDREVEGRCAAASTDTKLESRDEGVKALRNLSFQIGKKCFKQWHENNTFKKKTSIWKIISHMCPGCIIYLNLIALNSTWG